MRNLITTTVTSNNVSVYRRNRSVVVAVVTLGLRALDCLRFLLQGLPRHAQAAHAVAMKRTVCPAAAGAMGMSERSSSGITWSGWGLGGPGSGSPSGDF